MTHMNRKTVCSLGAALGMLAFLTAGGWSQELRGPMQPSDKHSAGYEKAMAPIFDVTLSGAKSLPQHLEILRSLCSLRMACHIVQTKVSYVFP